MHTTHLADSIGILEYNHDASLPVSEVRIRNLMNDLPCGWTAMCFVRLQGHSRYFIVLTIGCSFACNFKNKARVASSLPEITLRRGLAVLLLVGKVKEP